MKRKLRIKSINHFGSYFYLIPSLRIYYGGVYDVEAQGLGYSGMYIGLEIAWLFVTIKICKRQVLSSGEFAP